jgi:hypothetical protein
MNYINIKDAACGSSVVMPLVGINSLSGLCLSVLKKTHTVGVEPNSETRQDREFEGWSKALYD